MIKPTTLLINNHKEARTPIFNITPYLTRRPDWLLQISSTSSRQQPADTASRIHHFWYRHDHIVRMAHVISRHVTWYRWWQYQCVSTLPMLYWHRWLDMIVGCGWRGNLLGIVLQRRRNVSVITVQHHLYAHNGSVGGNTSASPLRRCFIDIDGLIWGVAEREFVGNCTSVS